MSYRIQKIQAKSVLQKSNLPDVDWVVNPYMGCRMGCKYCYATFVGRLRHPKEEWGSYVDVKMNTSELFQKELEKKLKNKKRKDIGTILFSSVTDPYQGLESKYQLTRKCLQVLIDMDYEGKVSILTKSNLVLRDIYLFKQLKNLDVGLTVTSTDDPISRYLETYAISNKYRIETLKKLHAVGIKTYAFVGPLLPHFVWMKKELEKLLNALKEAKVSYIYLEHINLSPYIRDRLFEYLKKDYPQELEKFKQAQSPEYRNKLDQLLAHLVKKVRVTVAHQHAIYHKDKKSWGNLRNNYFICFKIL